MRGPLIEHGVQPSARSIAEQMHVSERVDWCAGSSAAHLVLKRVSH